MKHIINKSAILVCLILWSTGVFAASEAEYGKVSKSWTVQEDGGIEYRYGMELTLFTHTAMNNTYGESFIVYNPNYQEVKIHSSYTRQKDGTIIKTPENAFVEVLPGFATNAAAYNHLVEMVVVHTGLELGATIYLDYSIQTKPGYYPALDVNELLQETSPVKEYHVSLSVPENRTISWQLYSSFAKAVERKDSGYKTISWTLRNIPASSRESFLAANKDNIPRLVASSFASQQESLKVLADRFTASDALEPQTFAEFITEGVNGKDEKLKIIHQYVVNELGTSMVALEHTGYTIRNGEAVVRSAYGTVAEKTQLLNFMLNKVGIESTVVAVYPATLDKDACGLKSIKSLAVKVVVEGKEQYLSATSMEPSAIPLRGGLDKLYTIKGEELIVPATPVVIKENVEIDLSVADAKNGFVVCNLPAVSSGIDTWSMNTLSSKRNELLEIPSLLQEEVVYSITLPPGMQLKSKAGTLVINKPFGKFTQSVTEKAGKVEVVRSMELHQMQFTPTEYADLRTLILGWMNPANRTLLLSTE